MNGTRLFIESRLVEPLSRPVDESGQWSIAWAQDGPARTAPGGYYYVSVDLRMIAPGGTGGRVRLEQRVHDELLRSDPKRWLREYVTASLNKALPAVRNISETDITEDFVFKGTSLEVEHLLTLLVDDQTFLAGTPVVRDTLLH